MAPQSIPDQGLLLQGMGVVHLLRDTQNPECRRTGPDAAHRFLCCAPTVWNSLPSFVRTADSFTSFRSQLKTYMFARHL